MRSTQCLGAPEVPQTAKRIASASVDFPLPRAPIMQVSPRGRLTLKPGRNPPLMSIFSTSHIGQTPGTGEVYMVPPANTSSASDRVVSLHLAGITLPQHALVVLDDHESHVSRRSAMTGSWQGGGA